jgi:hypothetical protein
MDRNHQLRLLKEQIERAFADTPYPGDDHITGPFEAWDWESEELRDAFRGKHWKELMPYDVFYHHDTFLCPAGFQFYLPAYLLAALDDYNNVILFTVFSLCPYHPPEKVLSPTLLAWNLRRYDQLTPEQKQAVCAFLDFVREDPQLGRYFPDRHEIDEAIEKYWSRHRSA